MTNDVEISVQGGIQVLRLTRSAKKNALTSAMYGELCEAFDRGDNDPAISVHLITGSGGVFTAGNDLGDFLATAQGTGDLGTNVRRFVYLLPMIRKPLIAAVDGVAIGVGTTMLFHCDLVYASPASTFATPFLSLGLIPEAGSSLLMQRRMGYARAFEMLALGETFSAEQAVQAGFVNKVVASGHLEQAALKAAQRLASLPPEALAVTRALMRGNPVEILQQTDKEVIAFRERLSSPEALEAFTAFFEKRSPNFRKPV